MQDSDVKTVTAGTSERGSRLLRGILDACLLALVAERDRYGYEIAAAMRRAGLELVRDGTIYPLLSRLEHRGLLDSYIAPSTNGPKRRYYTVTVAGQEELATAVAIWNDVARGVSAILVGHEK